MRVALSAWHRLLGILQWVSAGLIVMSLLLLLRPGTSRLPVSLLLFGGLALVAAAAALAARRSTVVVRQLVFAGIAGSAIFGVLAELTNLVWYNVLGGERVIPSPGYWLVLFGTHPCLIVGYAAAVRSRRTRFRIEETVDVLLLAMAAAIIGTAFVEFGDRMLVQAVPSTLLLWFWRACPVVEIALAGVLIGQRAADLGEEIATGLVLGTVGFGLATALQGYVAPRGPLLVAANYALFGLVLLGFGRAIRAALRAESDADERPLDDGDLSGVRGWAIVAATVMAAVSTLVVGFADEQLPTLAVAVAAFDTMLAVRAGYALSTQRKRASVLADRVVAEQEMTATLERRVSERTAELAEAERVLRRMWALGHQVALELDPTRVLERFMEAVFDIEQADGGALGLLVDGDRIRIAASIGVGSDLAIRTIPVEGTAMGRVIRSGRSWKEEDLAARPEAVHRETYERLGKVVRAIAVVPIRRGGETIGALSMVSLVPRRFTDDDLARLGAMTDMLSVALANAELVDTLKRAEWRYRTLFRSAPDAVMTAMASGRLLEANDVLGDIVGREPRRLAGAALEDLVIEGDREAIAGALASALAGRQARLEARFRRADGRSALVALAVRRVPEADPPSILLIGRDVTAEREMWARLTETQRLGAVAELVAGVAHEVNNPLGSISAFAQLLLREPGLTPQQRESVEVIRTETARASQVVRDLLAFARRSDSRREPVDLNELIERSLRLRSYELRSGRVKVEQSLDSHLPLVMGDARQLQQVLLNLMTNSIQAMSSSGGGTLRLVTRTEPGAAMLEVADTGPGIPAAARPRIFEPFFTTKPEGQGSGLGLSVSYGIVAAHGGEITLAESSPAGTRFLVRLPGDGYGEGAAAAPAEAARAESARAAAARSRLAGVRLLFVDDEPALRRGVERFAQMRGMSVVTADGGTAALAAARRQEFDAMVCDLRMPGMDGLALHEILRRERPALAARTVFVTGDVMGVVERADPDGEPRDRPRALAKPFSFDQLEAVLLDVLSAEAPSEA